MLTFEYDPHKSATNKDRHGINFEEAQSLWAVRGTVTPAPHPVERRFLRTAKMDGKFWTAVYTMRGANIRIISVRRARENEERNYVRQDPPD